jgi:hypothetical protein
LVVDRSDAMSLLAVINSIWKLSKFP